MKNKIDLIYNSWDQVPITIYRQIVDVYEDEMSSQQEKDLSALAILCGVPEEDIWNMQVQEINELRLKIKWLNDFSFKKKSKIKHIKVGDIKCDVMANLQEMTVSQYVDFQQYWSVQDWNSKIEKVLSVFIIPEGKKYGEGYDVTEFQQLIADNVSISLANSICFFFLKKCLSSILRSRIFLGKMVKKAKKMTLTQEEKEKIVEIEEKMAEMDSLYGFV